MVYKPSCQLLSVTINIFKLQLSIFECIINFTLQLQLMVYFDAKEAKKS